MFRAVATRGSRRTVLQKGVTTMTARASSSTRVRSTAATVLCRGAAAAAGPRQLARMLPAADRLGVISRHLATVTDASYKQSAFVQWKLFPDFQKALTQCHPGQAVPIFKQLLDAAQAKFLDMEKHFEPTWDGTIGQRMYKQPLRNRERGGYIISFGNDGF